MSDKIKTSAGIFTKGDWYAHRAIAVLVEGQSKDNPDLIRVSYLYGGGGEESYSVYKAKDLSELPPELNGGKIEPLPFEPVCDGVSLYQLSNASNFSDYVIRPVSEVAYELYVDAVNSSAWKYCRPVPQELRKFGD